MENSVNDLDTGQDPPQKKFVPTKQKFAAKKAAQKKKKSLENSRVTKEGEDERFANATTSLSSPKLNTGNSIQIFKLYQFYTVNKITA